MIYSLLPFSSLLLLELDPRNSHTLSLFSSLLLPLPASEISAPPPLPALTDPPCRKETYNSLHSTGYRDVMVNIRVVSDRAKQLGLSWHICELQLLLLDYAKIKSELGHSRYIQWRNTRGE